MEPNSERVSIATAFGGSVASGACVPVLAIVVAGHEDAREALGGRALAPQASDLLGLVVDLVVLEHGHLDLDVLVGDLLGLGVGLLLSLLLTTTAEAKHEVDRRLLLDGVVTDGELVLERLTGQDEALLVDSNTYRSIDSDMASERHTTTQPKTQSAQARQLE